MGKMQPLEIHGVTGALSERASVSDGLSEAPQRKWALSYDVNDELRVSQPAVENLSDPVQRPSGQKRPSHNVTLSNYGRLPCPGIWA